MGNCDLIKVLMNKNDKIYHVESSTYMDQIKVKAEMLVYFHLLRNYQ